VPPRSVTEIALLLSLTSGPFPSGFPTKVLYTFRFSAVRATSTAHPIKLDFFVLIIVDVECSVNYQARHWKVALVSRWEVLIWFLLLPVEREEAG
jgi:hypothetical protein